MTFRIFLFSFALAFSFVLGGWAPADIIPDGAKGVPNELLVEGMERFPDVTFVLSPLRYGGFNTTYNNVARGMRPPRSAAMPHYYQNPP
jgi:hypothetical protein